MEGRVPAAGYSALPITFNGILRSGTKLLFLTTMVEDQQHRISYLLRRKTPEGEEPAITSVRGLAGKRIGILPTIAYKSWIDAILKANGVNPEEVIILQIAPKLQPPMLFSGGVDALFTNDPGATAAIIEAGAEFITEEVDVPKVMGEPFAFGSFNVREDWASAHPDMFTRLIAAMDEAVAFVNANPVEAKLTMTPYLPEIFKAHIGKYPDARYLSSSQTSETAFRQLADRYYEMKIIPAPIDLTGTVVKNGSRKLNSE